jgi:hypothetical protein
MKEQTDMTRTISTLKLTVMLMAPLITMSVTGLSQAAGPVAQDIAASLKARSGVIDSVTLPNIGISDRVYLITESTQVRYAGRNAKPTSLGKGMRVDFKVAPYNGSDGPQPILQIDAR